jgi:AAA family ATP:ADP antiporter
MTGTGAAETRGGLNGVLARFVDVRGEEVRALVWSFVYFFALLTAYYIVRPVRDEMGVMLGRDGLKDVFLYVFLVMLAAVPLFGWIVATVSRRLVVPIVYGLFMAQLVGFWLAFRDGQAPPWLTIAFFVWVSVFNLFVISLFWSVMATHWHADQAKRLYGVVAAGGSLGALTGPFVAQAFVHALGVPALLLVSAGFLALALAAALGLQRGDNGSAQLKSERHHGRTWLQTLFAGALQVWRSPFLFRVALWVLLANVISTYFYFEQARIIGEAYTDRAVRVQLLARIDLTVSILTILAQVFVTAKFVNRFGVGWAAATLPAFTILGFVALVIAPGLATIIAIIVLERASHFAISNPAARVLYTVVDPDEKYAAQNFVDTVVYRGGDAMSGWYFDALRYIGLSPFGIALVTVPLSAYWFWLSFDLARRFGLKGGDTRAVGAKAP